MKYEKAKAEVTVFEQCVFMTSSAEVPGGVKCGVYSNGYCTSVSEPNPYIPGAWKVHKSGYWVWDDYMQTSGHWVFND